MLYTQRTANDEGDRDTELRLEAIKIAQGMLPAGTENMDILAFQAEKVYRWLRGAPGPVFTEEQETAIKKVVYEAMIKASRLPHTVE
jgi:hypothetical protein